MAGRTLDFSPGLYCGFFAIWIGIVICICIWHIHQLHTTRRFALEINSLLSKWDNTFVFLLDHMHSRYRSDALSSIAMTGVERGTDCDRSATEGTRVYPFPGYQMLDAAVPRQLPPPLRSRPINSWDIDAAARISRYLDIQTTRFPDIQTFRYNAISIALYSPYFVFTIVCSFRLFGCTLRLAPHGK